MKVMIKDFMEFKCIKFNRNPLNLHNAVNILFAYFFPNGES